jgi:hypothetical protein
MKVLHKAYFVLVLLLAVLHVPITQAGGVPTTYGIQNGLFSDGTNHWTVTGDPTTIHATNGGNFGPFPVTIAPPDGSALVILGETPPTGATQTWVTPDTGSVLAVTYAIINPGFSESEFNVSLNGSNIFRFNGIFDDRYATGWDTFFVNLSPGLNTIDIQARRLRGSSDLYGDSYGFFDFKTTGDTANVVPEPATSLLLVPGLLGLVLLSTRKTT